MRALALSFLFLFACSNSIDNPIPDDTDGGTMGTTDLGAGADLAMGASCSAANCAGCCRGGVCQGGASATECGKSGAACQVCDSLYACLPERTCGLDLTQKWGLTFLRAVISARKPNGDVWDFPGGDPDPFIQGTNYKLTSVENNTTSPYWNSEGTYTLQELQNGIQLTMYDEDVSFNDVISDTRILRVTEADLRAGQIVWKGWGSVIEMHFGLRKK